MVTLEEIKRDPEVQVLMRKGNEYLAVMGAIGHDERHANFVSGLSSHILKTLGYSQREAELAGVAGYLHDIGNLVNRYHHGRSGAILAYDILKRLEIPPEDIAVIMGAIGNHEEKAGYVVSNVAAALMLADKSDVHRSRVRKSEPATFTPRDRVNYAVENSCLHIDPEEKTITMELETDPEICSVMEYFEIFMTKMLLCRRAANFLDCRFGLVINKAKLL